MSLTTGTRLGPYEIQSAPSRLGVVGWPDASIPFHVIGQGLRIHRVLPAVLAVLLAASTATFARTAQTGFWFTPDLAPYRTLIELYREGRAEEAVEGVLAFDAKVVHQIVEDTGGSVFVAEDIGRLRAVFSQVISEFRSRYLLTYAPTGVEQGGWHELDVRVRGRGRKVQARRGYLR